MKTQTPIIDFNHLAQNVPLSLADEQLVKWWRKTYGKSMWLWSGFFLFLFPFMVFMFVAFLQGEMDLEGVLLFIPFELFFAWKLIGALRKRAKVNLALHKGLKQIHTGILKELKPSYGNYLKYNIANNIIKVNAPGPYTGLMSSRYLKDVSIRLETVALTAEENLLLAVQYPDIPPTESRIVVFNDSEERNQNEKENNRYTLKVMSFILPAMFVALLWASGANHILLIFCICVVIGLVVLWATRYINRRIQSFKDKLMITGVVTEVIEIRYHIGDVGMDTMRWYRLGTEMVAGHLNKSEHLAPGDRACFEYYVNEKGERKDVIRITHLT